MTPPWIDAARAEIGLKETPGPANTPRIMAWGQKLGAKVLGIVYPNDATPWCGLFTAYCISAVGLKPPAIAIRAKSWATWGEASMPCEGAVLVFQRPGGGHVGFYDSENATAYRVLGGNQSDAVGYTWIAKDRCIAVRWPSGFRIKGDRRFVSSGGQLSKNEA